MSQGVGFCCSILFSLKCMVSEPRRRVPVTFRTYTGKSASGELTLESFRRSRVITRAVLRGLAGLAVSGTTLFIPVVHFFLTPLAVVLTFVIIARTLAEYERIVSGRGSCPECHSRLIIQGRPFKLPFTDRCESCSRAVEVSSPETN